MAKDPTTILLIEDNPGDARLIHEMLVATDDVSFKLVVADRLSTGHRTLAENHFDVILLDLSLPDSHGLSTLDKTQAVARNTPIVVLTGLNDDALGVEAVARGAQDYLVKAFVDGPFLTRAITYAIERKRTEKALRYQAMLLLNVSDAVISTDREFNIKSWNRAAETIYGWQSNEVIGKPIGQVVTTTYPSDQSRDAAVESLFTTGSWHGEVVQRTKQGENINIFSSLALLADDVGNPAVVVAVNRNITEQKRRERQQLELTLEKEKVNILTRFVEGISHEVKTPLSVIHLAIENLERATRLDDLALRRTGQIKAQVIHIDRLVGAMLQMIKLEGCTNLFPSQQNLNRILTDVEFEIRPRAALKHIAVTFQLDDGLPPIDGDRYLLSQAFLNLLDNAVHFTPELGTITVTATTRDALIVVTITDTGIGIRDSDLPHIFEHFFRADQARTSRGTGLGLPITKKIIELHSGQMEVQSTLDEGSTFTVFLPVRSPCPPPAPYEAC